jgi:Thiamine pyrophosphate-requiring enzymes [acetolactate synthase, pyruvate dehydrogenase (cytochrome), glyoxylate carboligase, phosphonopyruvate decarboxylase]
MSRHGGKLLVDQLAVHGADTVFSVPGESFLALLDGLYESPIRLITCRHEAGAANMADAYGKLTGRPGIAVVTRGPGATHASVGVHTAFQDSTPLILLVGQVASDQEEREAFQEIDYRRMFGPMAKWVAQIDRADRIPEYIARAFTTACAGRPGPVVLALPEDMLASDTDAEDAQPFHVVQPYPGGEQVEELRGLLARAERPLVLLGGAGWTPRTSKDMQAFLEANSLPAGAAFRRQDSIDNDSPSYVGDVGIGLNPKLAARVREADLLLVVGPRLGEMTTSGYTLIGSQTLVHVHPGAEELGRVYRAALPILSGMEHFAGAVRDLRVEPRWGEWSAAARVDYEAWRKHDPMPGTLDLGDCIAHLRERVPDAIVTNGAGNFSAWVHRFWRWHDYPTQLAPTSGAMGYGVPAAIAAKLVAPDRTVICFAGDGDFLMSGQELATAVQYELPIIVLVVNNGMYGTIRMHQERHYPGRVVGTDLVNPDFAAYARAFGAYGATVTKTAQFADALEAALGAGTSALIELRTDPEAINPRTTLTKLREDAQR